MSSYSMMKNHGERHRLRQIGCAHQVAVALARGAAAFVEGPDDEALAAATIAGGEHCRHVGCEFSVLRFECFPIAAGTLRLDAEHLTDAKFRTEESGREQHEMCRPNFFAAGHFGERLVEPGNRK